MKRKKRAEEKGWGSGKVEWGVYSSVCSRWLKSNNMPGASSIWDMRKEDRRQSLAMNQPFMTRKLLPPLAKGLGTLPLLLLLSFFSPSTCANSLLTCCNKCLQILSPLFLYFLYVSVWVIGAKQAWNKADCTTSCSHSAWSVAGRQPPELFCSLLHLCPMPRVRFPFLSKSFTERDKSRPARGPPKEGDEDRREEKRGEEHLGGQTAICRLQQLHLIRQSEHQGTVLIGRVRTDTQKQTHNETSNTVWVLPVFLTVKSSQAELHKVALDFRDWNPSSTQG